MSARSGASFSDYCDANIGLFAEGKVGVSSGSQIRDWAAEMKKFGAFISYTSEQCSDQISDLFSGMGAG